MSNARAIAAVTATLRHLLDQGLNADVPGTKVTTRPPDKARDHGGNQVNLFLYHTQPNAAWRNMAPAPLPAETPATPPLALNLYYLLTVYGDNDDDPDPFSHRLLGQAMRLLDEHPVLQAEEMQAALPDNDLYRQAERVRIVLQPLSLDEWAKLWSAFQTPYRLSVAYEVSVVLIDRR
jgi:hypothetical protein